MMQFAFFFLSILVIALAVILYRRMRHQNVFFDKNPVPSWIYDIETLRILAVNDAAVKAYGYTRRQFTAMNLKQLRPAEDCQQLLNAVQHIRNELVRSSDGWRHIKADGSLIDVNITSSPIRFRQKDCRLVVACDTGELTRARQSLLAANGELTRLVNASEALAEKLQVQNDSLRHINYSISHIVRAPLANLLGLVNLINEQGIYHPDSEVFLQYLKTVADQLDDAIHDVVKENASGLQVHK